MVVEIENFHGCYLLVSTNPKYKGWTYIGYTVDPKRRINQHNKGSKFGGARRTSGRGPWDMVLIIYGFPNEISALRFEWAWQHPKRSRRLRHVTTKARAEKRFDYNLRVAANMLCTGPWNRLPLTIQWLKQEYRKDFDVSLQPPSHMPIAFGQVTSTKVGNFGNPRRKKKRKKGEEASSQRETTDISDDDDVIAIPLSQTAGKRCDVCQKRFKPEDSTLTCLYPQCTAEYHMVCLAQRFLRRTPELLVPVEGTCPKCKEDVLWGNLIRKKQGCYASLTEIPEEDTADHWAEELRL